MALITENIMEMSLRELATPTLEELDIQRSKLEVATNSYELKPGIIRIAAENSFSGITTDNPYKHITKFNQICNTFQQEGVPAEWFKWNLFPFTLVDEAKKWYSLASKEVEGDWNLLVQQFVLRFFPLVKVHKLRRQVANFE
jgi:hypothetical protein